MTKELTITQQIAEAQRTLAELERQKQRADELEAATGRVLAGSRIKVTTGLGAITPLLRRQPQSGDPRYGFRAHIGCDGEPRFSMEFCSLTEAMARRVIEALKA